MTTLLDTTKEPETWKPTSIAHIGCTKRKR